MLEVSKNFEKVISHEKEMLAYELLWFAINQRKIKEANLKQMLKKDTPLDVLDQLFNLKENKDLFEASSCVSSYSLPFHDFEKEDRHNQNQEAELQEWIKKSSKKVSQFLEESSYRFGIDFSLIVNKNFQYPEDLNSFQPIGLFYYKGDLTLLETRCISIVGTRNPSSVGISIAKEMVRGLSREGLTVVSGLAKGIDKIAHQVTIESKGQTIAVIGTPLNKYYPKENKFLQNEIAEDHLLISQVPFYAYSQESFRQHSYHFPRRTKTMASLSEATLIIEASETKGSFIQARECLEQNKKLFIMENCFNNSKVNWSQKYEKKGAIRVKNIQDILKNL